MLHDFIAAHRAEILQRCLQTLKLHYPQSPDDELLNGVPSFVSELTSVLRQDAHAEERAREAGLFGKAARKHGMARRAQGFNLSRIVYDYGLVCEVVSGLASEDAQTFSAREFQILNWCIHESIVFAIESFEETRAAEEKDLAEHLAFVVHEVRNAVGNALAGFELIRNGKADTEGHISGVVRRALERIANLVSESLAEVRSKRTGSSREWMRLCDLLAPLVAENPAKRGVQVRIDAADDLYMHIDERLLASALTNLLQNAIKFTRDDQVIVLRAFPLGRTVIIEVEDRCGGLPEGTADNLFHGFGQTSSDRRGTGLGLTIARRAIEAHGGKITARNLPGTGCVFAISLPRSGRFLS